MIQPRDYSRWAKGIPHNAIVEDDEAPSEDLEGEGEDEAPGEAPAIWSGNDTRSDEELEKLPLEEAQAFVAWMDENEPELAGAMKSVESAAIGGAIGEDEDLEAARSALMAADQFVTPELPEFGEAQRAKFVEVATSELAQRLDAMVLMTVAAGIARRAPVEEEELEEPELDEAIDPEETTMPA